MTQQQQQQQPNQSSAHFNLLWSKWKCLPKPSLAEPKGVRAKACCRQSAALALPPTWRAQLGWAIGDSKSLLPSCAYACTHMCTRAGHSGPITRGLARFARLRIASCQPCRRSTAPPPQAALVSDQSWEHHLSWLWSQRGLLLPLAFQGKQHAAAWRPRPRCRPLGRLT